MLKKLFPLKTLPSRFRFKYLPVFMRSRMTIKPRHDIQALGSGAGVWKIPGDLVNASSVCYCVGVGTNATFDEELIKRYGCDVHAFDPTPQAVSYGRALAAREPKFHFHEVGLWNEDTTLKFHFPENPDWDVYSAVNLGRNSRYVECKVERMSTIMKRLGHEKIDLLKLDIEGAEYVVLDDLIASEIFPTVLAVEFDQPMPVRKTLAAVRRLNEAGYALVQMDLWNYIFVRGATS